MWATLLKIETPACSWCRHASTRHPKLALKVTSYYARPGGSALEVVEIEGRDWDAVVREIRELDTVDDVEVLESSEDGARVRIEARECALPAAIAASGIVPQLPFEIEQGCDKWLLLGPQPRAKEFYHDLTAAGQKVSVVFSGEYEPEARLTPRQQEILSFALQEGYYDYPRRITMTRLAEKLGISKSTLSEMLMVVESEVMHSLRAQGAAATMLTKRE